MNAISSNVEQWSKTVDQFVKGHANGLPPEDREDLRQDIFVALLEVYGSFREDTSDELLVDLVALAVLDRFREERRARLAPLTWTPVDVDTQVRDTKTTNLDLRLDIRGAVSQLPTGLQNVAVDMFYHELTQQEIAVKYNRTQPWVAVAKKQIVKKIYSLLQEKKPCR